MAEDKVFTQEEVNKLVGAARLEGREAGRKEFEGYISPDELTERLKDPNEKIEALNQQVAALTEEKTTLTNQITEKDAVIAKNEKDSVKKRVAIQMGIPYEMADRLVGDDEEAIKADAERLASLFKSNEPKPKPNPLPLNDPESGGPEDGVVKRFKELNPNIKL